MKRSAIGFILLLAVTVPLCSCGKAGTEQPQDNAGDTSSEIISAVTDTPPIQGEETNEPEASNGFEEPSQIEFGSEIIRGFTFDNILHSDNAAGMGRVVLSRCRHKYGRGFWCGGNRIQCGNDRCIHAAF